MLLALATAGLWGTSAFIAGSTARRIPALLVVLASQALSLILLVAAAPLWPSQVAAADLWWGQAAGLGTAVGLVAFYRGLAVGRMSVVSPLTALVSVAVPAVIGVALGGRPSALVTGGLAAGAAAVVLLSAPGGHTAEAEAGHRGIPYAFVAGLGFSLFLVGISQASTAAGLWPLVATRVSSVAVLGVALLVTRPGVGQATRAWRPLAVIAVLEVVGAALYFAATAAAALTVVVVLANLHPLVTVLWARTLLREPLGLRRSAGVAAALAAMALILSG